MEEHGNKLRSVFLGSLDVLLQLVLDVEVLCQLVGADEGNFNPIDVAVIDAVVAKGPDPCVFQG